MLTRVGAINACLTLSHNDLSNKTNIYRVVSIPLCTRSGTKLKNLSRPRVPHKATKGSKEEIMREQTPSRRSNQKSPFRSEYRPRTSGTTKPIGLACTTQSPAKPGKQSTPRCRPRPQSFGVKRDFRICNEFRFVAYMEKCSQHRSATVVRSATVSDQ